MPSWGPYAWQFLLIFSAIAIGWWLGRRKRSSVNAELLSPYHNDYYKGLNYLLNDQSDAAIDSFVDKLEVNSETLETHLSIGNLMRRKGEVERAIRIHQNLLARPSLAKPQVHRAHLELARDFIAAGLLDLAERLLEELLLESPDARETAGRHLLEIYQDEREWQKAIDIAQSLLPKRSLLLTAGAAEPALTRAIAHYYCELAEPLIKRNDLLGARSKLKQALAIDKQCVRASLLIADIEFRNAHYNQSLKSLKRVAQQDPALISETLQPLKNCYRELHNSAAYREYLLSCLEQYPSASIMLALVDNIQQEKGDVAAGEFIGQALKHRPSLRGLAKLVELHIAGSSGSAKENLGILQLLIEQLLVNKASYQCQHCGFSGRQMHWLCPSCKQWGQIQSIRGADAD